MLIRLNALITCRLNKIIRLQLQSNFTQSLVYFGQTLVKQLLCKIAPVMLRDPSTFGQTLVQLCSRISPTSSKLGQASINLQLTQFPLKLQTYPSIQCWPSRTPFGRNHADCLLKGHTQATALSKFIRWWITMQTQHNYVIMPVQTFWDRSYLWLLLRWNRGNKFRLHSDHCVIFPI